ncbi:MAG: 16S rRNA (uracil(1498)-N(3))-methyltransferase [Ignavibacteriales bacterium]|nr:16S rRNA (uracil(1498)-N(3))-methyltransferase [Ignavibacteriales bacterium]
MDYFYSPPQNISAREVIIDGDEYAHLTHVMRKTANDTIRVVDGLGTAYDVRLTDIKKKTAHGVILQKYQQHNEQAIDVTIAVGILKNPSKFDFLVEKATELGVRQIIPLITERTIPSHAKIDRWQKLALAAMKQCGRSFLPIVKELTNLDNLLNQKDSDAVKLIAHENPLVKIKSNDVKLTNAKSAIVLIGPEGGFSDDEVLLAEKAGYSVLYLGERRLRTETAAIVATAKLIG